MIVFPNAKINLGLNIVNKRNDGFHDLETIFYPIDCFDALEVVRSNKFSLNSEGIKIPGNSNENLCKKAYELLRSDYDIEPIEVSLLKKIPIGGGLGGGSSDGAYMLKLLNQLYELNISIKKLKEYASMLGSDCSFFLLNENLLESIFLHNHNYTFFRKFK